MTRRLSVVTAALLNRFQLQRPLRGGSLLITIFGDAIVPRGGAISVASLIGLAAPFGLNERLVRTAMTRLADDGWLVSRRLGRLSEYRLSGEGRARFAPATQQIYSAPLPPWSGRWTLVLLPPAARAQRQAARQALTWAGFGEAIPGVFAHPSPLIETMAALKRRTPALTHALAFATHSGAEAPHRELAAMGWNLGDLSQRYQRFVATFSPLERALTAAPTPLQAFLIRTLLIHEYRKIHLRDPLLPAALLPSRWVGTDAYRLCRDLYARVAPASERHLSLIHI